MKILYICQGNIGRSQVAEAFTNNGSSHVATSAGIDDVGHKYNYNPYDPLVKILKKDHNIDMSSQKVKKITKKMVKGIDEIHLLCKQEECTSKIPKYVTNFKKLINHDIEDPNKKAGSLLIEIVNEIKEIVTIINHESHVQ